MTATNAGSVLNSFESDEDCFGKPLAISHRQSMIGFSSDEFRRLFGLAPPNYIKIDVHGIEEEILDGAKETLTDAPFRSVLIELEHTNTPSNGHLIERIERAGFTAQPCGSAPVAA